MLKSTLAEDRLTSTESADDLFTYIFNLCCGAAVSDNQSEPVNSTLYWTGAKDVLYISVECGCVSRPQHCDMDFHVE